ncbi:DUF4426 domain-containing protein [Luteimonas vadosa]|uniref:DUF4426 domain-containing protein n=1 Tax=Luteimonas vadosa TaxID=1165507 RepID=A0ABP9DX35_9GAMM
MRLKRQRLAIVLFTAAALTGCGSPSPQAEVARQQAAAPQEASVQFGDIIVRANAVATSGLSEPVARQYGVSREAGTVMLLVGVRRIADGDETSLPARVTARAVDLLGKRQAPEMREVRSGGFIDYVATVRVAAPETLRFDVDVATADGQRASLQFNRDFFP